MKQTSAVVRLALGRAWAYRILQKILVQSNTRQSVIGRYVQPRARDRIVDIGCGPADILEHLPDVHYFGIVRWRHRFSVNISQHHRNDMLRVPYDHLLMTCS
jgi:hypothetical protein